MSAHPSAFKRLATQITEAKSWSEIDAILDLWNEYKHLATDWDAGLWGFKTDSWMRKERLEMSKRVEGREVRTDSKKV